MDDDWTTPYTIRMRRVRDGVERDVPWLSSSDPDAELDPVDTLRREVEGLRTRVAALEVTREYVIVRVTREDGTVVMEGDPTADGDPDPDEVV